MERLESTSRRGLCGCRRSRLGERSWDARKNAYGVGGAHDIVSGDAGCDGGTGILEGTAHGDGELEGTEHKTSAFDISHEPLTSLQVWTENEMQLRLSTR